jgi:hypothetical protein
MNRFLVVLSVLVAFTVILPAQPMSGNYTIGGTSPDFAALQDVANAIKLRGVSGPVFVNIRPGTYTRNGGASRLMILDSIIAGVSPINRITFQPDVASGGNPSNVILQADFNSSTPLPDRILVLIGTDHITLRNLTFRDADSMDAPASSLLDVEGTFFVKPTVEDLVVDGCTFLGSRFVTAGVQFGTDYGLSSNPGFGTGFLLSGVFTNNVFDRLLRFISVASIPHGGTFDAEGNVFRNGYTSFTGSGNPLGAAIDLTCAHATVKENDVRFSTGNEGIVVSQAVTALIERNIVRGTYRLHGMNINRGSSQGIVADSIIIVNNIVYCSAGTSMFVQTVNTKLLHNTVFNFGGFGTSCVFLDGRFFTSTNNIFINEGIRCYDQASSTDIVSDYNLIFGGGELVVHAGISYSSLESYRAASHLDSNSTRKDVPFLTDSLGIHIEECQAQDRVFNGTPLPGVRFDYYGTTRDTVTPFIGAVEGVRLPYNMFAAPFKAGLSGMAFSIAAGRFDNSSAPGIAVPDYDNRQVFLFHNTGASRTFSHTGTVFTGFRPVEVRFADFDGDNNLDLIVGGDTSSIRIFWGDGAGGFSSPTVVGTSGRVRSLEPVYFNGQHANTIWITEDNGFLPNMSFLGNLVNLGNRQLCHDITYRVEGSSYVHDTIPSVMTALAVGEFDITTSGYEIATLAFNGVPRFMITRPEEILFATPCQSAGRLGFSNSHVQYPFPAASFLGFGSNMAVGDFDGDGDKDFITTGASENECVFLRNQGNATFAVDTISTTATRGVAALDYENDGDLDFVTINRTLDSLGITIFLNDGTGRFTEKGNCHYPFASGWPNCIVAADFDLDGRKDIASVSRTLGGHDSLFVLYNLGGFNGTTGVAGQPPSETPQGFALLQNYPNPFNPSTRIEYTLPVESGVAIKVYNILGQEIATLINEQQTSGRHVVEWNGRSTNGFAMSSGVYFYRVEARQNGGQLQFVSVKKMLLLK